MLEFRQRSILIRGGAYQNVNGRKEGSRFPRRHLEPVTSVVKISGCKIESFDCNFQNQIHFQSELNPFSIILVQCPGNKKWISFSLVVINKWLHCEKIKQKQTRYQSRVEIKIKAC